MFAKGTWGPATAAAGAPGAIASGTGARRDGENPRTWQLPEMHLLTEAGAT